MTSRSPREKTVPSKLQSYVLGSKPSGSEPSGTCPKCQVYVEDTGVVCEKCQAYWHFPCVGVTQQEVNEKWDDKPFLCPSHRASTPDICCVAASQDLNVGESIVHRVHSYTLNPQITNRKLLSSLNIKPKIEPRENEEQYYIKICPPSFELIVANMTEFGKQWGITIKAAGLDNQGTKVATQFNMNLNTASGLLAD